MKCFNAKKMKEKQNWKSIILIIGMVTLVIGAIDPLEGSVIIAAGSLLIALSTYLTRHRYWKIFLASLIMIIFGMFFMFYLSNLGGFGGKSELSWWWGILILPYPIGWVMTIVFLFFKSAKKPVK